MPVLYQLCHIYKQDKRAFDVGFVKEIYDEYIVIETKRSGEYRVRYDKINDDERITFLHKNGQPVLIKKGLFGYKFP